MSVETWEEACQYIWKENSYGTELTVSVDDGRIYYQIVGRAIRHFWFFEVTDTPQNVLGKSWSIIGNNPEYSSPLTPQEKVCKKIAMMEARWKNYQQRKQHG